VKKWYRNIEGIPKETIRESELVNNPLWNLDIYDFLTQCKYFDVKKYTWENIQKNEYNTDILNSVISNKHTIVLSERQIGFSTILTSVGLYYTQILNKDVFVARKGGFERFKMMYMMLPENLKYGVVELNKNLIKFKNGSSVRFFDDYNTFSFGSSANIILIDHCDIVNDQEKLSSIIPIVNSRKDCKLLIGSYIKEENKNEYCLYNFEILDWRNYDQMVNKIQRDKKIDDILNA
jgi:hypothetical protein